MLIRTKLSVAIGWLCSLLVVAKTNVAIIGGGIGGTSLARYLSQYDAISNACGIGSVTIFDPSPQLSGSGKGEPGGAPTGGSENDLGPDRQGPRVSSITLEDGTVIELGASIVFSGNQLISEVVDSDPNLERAEPLTPGKDKNSRGDAGFGIYDGEGHWPLVIRPETPDYVVLTRLMWRYGLDLVRVRNAALKALDSFNTIYSLLNSTSDDTFFASPDDLWRTVGLHHMTTMSFDAYLDTIGVSGGNTSYGNALWRTVRSLLLPIQNSVWGWLLPLKGNLRREICESVNINNYNQNNQRLDGLAGLVSFLPTQGSVYSVAGGNAQLLSSAFRQAVDNYDKHCSGVDVVQHVQSVVTDVLLADDGVFQVTTANGQVANKIDIVILAAPMQQARVNFLHRRTRDSGLVRLPMDGFTDEQPNNSTSRQYTQTFTTVLSNATLQNKHFGMSSSSKMRAISITEKGKSKEGFSALAELTDDGKFKMFSSEQLTDDALGELFGSEYAVEYVKNWGGEHGGAYPDFAGGGAAVASSPFVLYSGERASLYYANAMEASVSAMEISAISAKMVAKLVARKLGLI